MHRMFQWLFVVPTTAILAGLPMALRKCYTFEGQEQWILKQNQPTTVINKDLEGFFDGTACMGLAEGGKKDHIWLWACIETPVNEHAKQQWIFDSNSLTLKNLVTDKCLQDNVGTPPVGLGGPTPSYVTLAPCSASSSNQQWSYDTTTQRLISKSGLCLSTTGAMDNPAFLTGPQSPSEYKAWAEEMGTLRDSVRSSLKLNDSVHQRLPWVQDSFMQPQVMIHDRFFYDVYTHQYTVEKFVDDLVARYGGVESVLLWQAYPNIGIDNRNQFDLMRDMPGGMSALRDVARRFRAKGVRVLWPWNPWDTATRDEGMADNASLGLMMKEVESDGMFADTVTVVPQSYYDASIKAGGNPLSIEPECCNMTWSILNYVIASWGYWNNDKVPNVDALKWFDRKHLTRVCNRWKTSRLYDLQDAFFNGAGYETWENVWGIWNGYTARDGEANKRVSAMLRYFHTLIKSEKWEPHTPSTVQPDVYASKWESEVNDDDDDDDTLWFLVNRAPKATSGVQLILAGPVDYSSYQFYDCYHGVPIKPTRTSPSVHSDSSVSLSFSIEGDGFGCVLMQPQGKETAELVKFLTEMNKLTARPLSDYSEVWEPLPQKIVPHSSSSITGNERRKSARPSVAVPKTSSFRFEVSGIMIEPFTEFRGVDVQYPWESEPTRHHSTTITIDEFSIDQFPVTNSEYAQFLIDSGYKPRDSHNFLKHWTSLHHHHHHRQSNSSLQSIRSLAALMSHGNGTDDRRPVVWVSVGDAQEFCQFYGGRLPHEWEWQYAAQGVDGRQYPWGNTMDSTRMPPREGGRAMGDAPVVGSHPSGASPFGAQDMAGNVWQWTDVYEDAHTRAAIVRGGSYYRPNGSMWYFPNDVSLNTHGKLLLLDDSYDRSGTVGFRCLQSGAQLN